MNVLMEMEFVVIVRSGVTTRLGTLDICFCLK